MAETNAPTPTELRVVTAWGTSRHDLVVALVHPGEKALGIRRTFLMRLVGDRELALVEVVPEILHHTWRADHGTVYCPLADGRMLIREPDGSWQTEVICRHPEAFDAILGFSGVTADEDVVLLLSNVLFVRRGPGLWQEHAMPDEIDMVNSLHGLAANEVYITTAPGLLQWDGAGVAEMEGPDEELFGVVITPADELYVAGEALHRFTEANGWQRVEAPVFDFTIGMTTFQGRVYIAALDGICSVTDSIATLEDPLPSNSLITAGDVLVAIGSESGAKLHYGATWSALVLPSIVAGESL